MLYIADEQHRNEEVVAVSQGHGQNPGATRQYVPPQLGRTPVTRRAVSAWFPSFSFPRLYLYIRGPFKTVPHMPPCLCAAVGRQRPVSSFRPSSRSSPVGETCR